MTAIAPSHHSPLQTRLASGLSQMGLAFDLDTQDKLLRYVALLEKWNKVYNLTAIRDPQMMIGLHILDSLSVLPSVTKYKRLLDVGTGGGLPGIPLAIALASTAPAVTVTLLDTINKKTTFVRQVIAELALANAEVVTARVESYQPERLFDAVIARAFSELSDFVGGAGHLCTKQGRMLAMKGVYPNDEIARLPEAYVVEDVIALQVPQIEGKRHLVILKNRLTT